MEYEDFALRIEEKNDHYQVEAVSHLGRARREFSLPFDRRDIRDVVDGISDTIARRRRPGTVLENRLERFGQQLFDSLFQGEVLSLFNDAYLAAGREEQGLRVKLSLLPAELAALPWEFMYNPARNFRRFLALLGETPVVRHVEDANSPRPVRELLPPLRILGMVARPKDLPPLDWEHEKRRIEQPLQEIIDRGLVWIDWLESGSLGALRDALSRRDHQYHIFHFVGHGQFDEQHQEGVLLLEGPDGYQQAVDGEVLGLELFNHRYLRLAFLNACQSAQVALENPFAGVAPALVRAGIPAVAAMQFALTDESAAAFSYQFYHSLSQGHPVESAVASARMALFPRRTGEWAIPVLYLSIPGDQVFPFTYELRKLEKRVDSLIDQRRWPEVVRLCTLMRTTHPHRQRQAQSLELLASAHVQVEEGDWHEAHELAVRGQALIGDARFQPLIDQAREEAYLLDTYRRAARAFEAGSPIEALRRCEEILAKRPNHGQARALRHGIEAEERLKQARPEIEALVQSGDWAGLARAVAPHLATAPVDREAAAVAFPHLDRFSELAELADLQVQAAHHMAAGRWADAEATFRQVCTHWPDHCPKEDQLYAEALQLAADPARRPEAIHKLAEILEGNPHHRDTAAVLLRLEDAQDKLEEMGSRFEDALERHDWAQARVLCGQIAEVDPSQRDAGALTAELDRAVEILERLLAPLVADPLLEWSGGFPYTLFSRVGITPRSSMEEVRAASFDLQQGAMSQEERNAYDALRSVSGRLTVDSHLYPVKDLARLVESVEDSLTGKLRLPTAQEAIAELEDDAAVLLVAMGDRESAARVWSEAQGRRPDDSRLAHCLALLHTWGATAEDQMCEESSADLWSSAIANWSMVLEDRSYWSTWAEEREGSYDAVVAAGHVDEALQAIHELLRVRLSHQPDLELAFDEELSAVRMLHKAGGLPVPGHPTEKFACGPSLLAVLELQPALADLIAKHSVEATDIVDLLKRTAKIDWSVQELRRRFSSLSQATALLDRGDLQGALGALEDASCGGCPPCSDPECPTHKQPASTPRVCCASCPQFEPRNPAYTRLPDPAGTLQADAADLAIIAHLGLAEAAMARQDPSLPSVRQHWLAATSQAEALGNLDRVKGVILDKTLGRINYLFKEGDEGEALLEWTGQVIELADLALEFVSKDSTLVTGLARALTIRGIRRANRDDIWGAEADLRRAFGLNPTMVRTRHQFAVALTVIAKLNWERDRWTSAQMLREAETIVREGLKDHPDHDELQDQLQKIQEVQDSAHKEPEPVKTEDPWAALRKVLAPKKPTTLDELATAFHEDPSNSEIRQGLIRALVDEGERLVGRGHRIEAGQLLEEWLPEFPDEEPLQLLAGYAREGHRAEACLAETGLKRRMDLWERHTFHLPFHSDFVRDLEVQMRVVGDLAAISAAVPPLPSDDATKALTNLLQATEAMPLHKISSLPLGQPGFVAEVPASLLEADILEHIIRTTSRCADFEEELYQSPEELVDRLTTHHEFRFFVQPIQRIYDALSGDPLPAVCAERDVACRPVGDGQYIVGSKPSPEIVAHCTDYYAHFTVHAGPLRAKGASIFQRIADINAAIRLCKVVLGPHLEVIFRVDLPGLSPETVARAVMTLERSYARYMGELVD